VTDGPSTGEEPGVGDPARRYTPEEATAMLPALIESLERIRSARQLILSRGERVRSSAAGNGGGEPGPDYWEAMAVLRREIESLTEQNILLRDPETGLLDFPARIDGKDVLLCWRVGEDRVEFWHGPETGFSGRRPILP
jgi:hypothetical protein